MVLHMVSLVQVAVSGDEPMALVQHLRGNRESRGFCDLQIVRLNEQTRTPNATRQARLKAGAQRTL